MRFYHLDALLSVYTWWLIFIDSLSPFYQFFSPIVHRDKHGWIIQSLLFSERIFLRKNRDQMLQFFRSLLFRNNDDDYFADTEYLERKRNSQFFFFFALIMQFINNAHKWKEFLSKYIHKTITPMFLETSCFSSIIFKYLTSQINITM